MAIFTLMQNASEFFFFFPPHRDLVLSGSIEDITDLSETFFFFSHSSSRVCVMVNDEQFGKTKMGYLWRKFSHILIDLCWSIDGLRV